MGSCKEIQIMTIKNKNIIIVYGLLASLVLPHPIQARISQKDIPQPILSILNNMHRYNNVLQEYEEQFRSLASSRPTLNLEEFKIKTRARARATYIGQILSFDLNNDGTVQISEVNELNPNTMPNSYEIEFHQSILNADINKDGVIIYEEMLLASKAIPDDKVLRPYDKILALNFDNDNSLTLDEVKQGISEIFKLIDTNNDSILSQEEKQLVLQNNR
jgi:Ca2+-binding EF-hand superfamily protein